ncbi:MAG: hypothetical protein WBC13_08925 [Dokdonella sp.]
MSILTNIKKRGLKDIFSMRVFSYINSKLQSIFGVWTVKKDQLAYSEQILFKGLMCPECKEKGECVECGCNFYDLSVAKNSVCSAGRWGEVMNSKSWAEYKSKYLSNVEFGLVKKKIKE